MRKAGAIVILVLGSGAVAGGCSSEVVPSPTASVSADLNAAERIARCELIKTAARSRGLDNPLLLGGIADAETGLAHCWSEATWACQGPDSVDCDGGPVIAGAGDGPCSLLQGGLGMFQFDAGTFSDTLAREGDQILTIDGNVQAGVDFAVNMVIRSTYVPDVATEAEALAWMNEVRVDGPTYDAWVKTVTHYYNGCTPSGCSVYNQRYAHYESNMRGLLTEMGEDFWYSQPEPCLPLPSGGGLLEENSSCFVAGGNPSGWRSEASGSDGGLLWTYGTDVTDAENYGEWQLGLEVEGNYLVEAHTPAPFAQSTSASYELSHGMGQTSVTLDQSAVDGWQALGVYQFASGQPYALRLNDVTGEALSLQRKLVFDAIRVSLSNEDPWVGGTASGGASGSAGSAGVAGSAGSAGATSGGAASGGAANGGSGGQTTGNPTPASSSDDGGCALHAPGGSSPTAPWAGLLALGWLLRRRR